MNDLHTVARRIARTINAEAAFAGDLQIVFDGDGTRVASFPGGNALVHRWSGWREGYSLRLAGNGRRTTARAQLELCWSE